MKPHLRKSNGRWVAVPFPGGFGASPWAAWADYQQRCAIIRKDVREAWLEAFRVENWGHLK